MNKKFISVEKFADNGEFSHYELVDENEETIIKDIMQAKEQESKFDKVEKEIQNRINNTYKHLEKGNDGGGLKKMTLILDEAHKMVKKDDALICYSKLFGKLRENIKIKK